MPVDYTTAQLMADILNTVKDAAVIVVPVACLLAGANFIIGWFMHSLTFITKKPFQGR